MRLDAPLPTTVDFGYGFVVRVKMYPSLRGCDGEWCGLAHSVDPMTIRIASATPIWRQHEVFAHELVHASLDFFQWLRDNFVDEMRGEAVETAAITKEVD